MKNRIFIGFTVLLLFTGIFSEVTAEQGYLIGDEDILQISVWGNPELNVQVPVRPDGMISFPLAGDVKASGVSPRELKSKLENELSKFVKTPTVSVMVTAINSFKVYVIGEGITLGGTNSGVITLRRNTSLMQLLAQVGSLKNADLNSAYILRDGKKLNNDFFKLIVKGDISQDIQLKPNDIIFIPDNFEKRIIVVGAVKNPGIIQYREGLTIVDAILNTGGFTEFAKQNDVLIVRKEGDTVKNIEARMKDVIKDGDISKDILLKPGDFIIVKTGIF
ncbi:MAG: polysaccharide biosynthesis/export family protein [Thermodesulfovibrionales bacterium]